MGLKNPNNDVTYLRVRDGAFYVGKDKENPQRELEGRITKMYYKDEEYEGTPVRKLIVRMEDEKDVFQLSLNTESQNYTSFVGFLKGVDINETLTLHPKVEDGERDGKSFKKNGILISQNGTYAKSYFTKATPNGAPEWKMVKIGKKNVTDKSEYLAFLEDFVTENYINQLQGSREAVVEHEEEPVKSKQKEEVLPWDE